MISLSFSFFFLNFLNWCLVWSLHEKGELICLTLYALFSMWWCCFITIISLLFSCNRVGKVCTLNGLPLYRESYTLLKLRGYKLIFRILNIVLLSLKIKILLSIFFKESFNLWHPLLWEFFIIKPNYCLIKSIFI